MDQKQELVHFLLNLQELGREYSKYLVSLTQVVQPTLQDNLRIPLLKQVFSEIPQVLSQAPPHQIQQYLLNPATTKSHPALQLFFELFQLHIIFKNISPVQLIHLTDCIPLGSSTTQQLQILKKVQERLQSWSLSDLHNFSSTLKQTPHYLIRNKMTELDPSIPAEIIHIIIKLLTSEEPLTNFKQWLDSAPQYYLILMVNLFQIEQNVLVIIRTKISGGAPSGSPHPLTPVSSPSPSFKADHPSTPQPLSPPKSRKRPADAIEFTQARSPGVSSSSPAKIARTHDAPVDMGHLPVTEQVDPLFPDIESEIYPPPLPVNNNQIQYQPPHMSATPVSPPMMAHMPLHPVPATPINTVSYYRGNGPVSPPIVGLDGMGMGPAVVNPYVGMNGLNGYNGVGMNGYGVNPINGGINNGVLNGNRPSPGVVNYPLVGNEAPKGKPDGLTNMPYRRPDSLQSPVDLPLTISPNVDGMFSENLKLQLKVNKQPPAQTVYQRILKPYPSIILIGPDSEAHNDFFVEASLLRSDANVDLPMCLDGTRVVRIVPGQSTTFKRLKILSTTQQQGTLFRLKFQLKRHVDGNFTTLHGIQAVSNPIEVYSHTSYINKDRKSGSNVLPTPPVVKEVLPCHGSAVGGLRVVVLGANFSNTPKLLVKFGEATVHPVFHESGTLICTTLPGVSGQSVIVRVTNDGIDYCSTFATFTYD
eukprot:TRINITY_DN14095_c0_g1_i1.p1 TRINITY_DN14095_c0_g1~~TRINITY_DN14095_c0_g1_i1.p1  ORF type:complete len:701 (-),score=105.90 TRINITY_DN14095_c0_g1_i1:119-2221(-)